MALKSDNTKRKTEKYKHYGYKQDTYTYTHKVDAPNLQHFLCSEQNKQLI